MIILLSFILQRKHLSPYRTQIRDEWLEAPRKMIDFLERDL